MSVSKKSALYSAIDKVIFDYNLIQDGDKILVGASGGKDSTALIEYFSNRIKRKDSNFTFSALNIQTEFGGALPENIVKLFDEWNVDLKVVKVDVQGRLKEDKKMSCYWCSTQRRTELNKFAMENGYNKIALGHHLDDVLETFLMNALQKSQFSTMIPSLKYKKYPITVIRPLYYAMESVIIEHAKKNGYYGYTCTCNFQDNSTRKSARQKIFQLTEGNPVLKQHFFDALKNINSEYLP